LTVIIIGEGGGREREEKKRGTSPHGLADFLPLPTEIKHRDPKKRAVMRLARARARFNVTKILGDDI